LKDAKKRHPQQQKTIRSTPLSIGKTIKVPVNPLESGSFFNKTIDKPFSNNNKEVRKIALELLRKVIE